MRIGIDMLKASRLARNSKKEEFLKKHFSVHELEHFNNRGQHLQTLAGMFCAKEAFLKAIGVGIFNGILLPEVEVCHNENGQPVMKIPAEIAEKYKVKNISLSITHDAGFAVAVCVIND